MADKHERAQIKSIEKPRQQKSLKLHECLLGVSEIVKLHSTYVSRVFQQTALIRNRWWLGHTPISLAILLVYTHAYHCQSYADEHDWAQMVDKHERAQIGDAPELYREARA